MYNIQIIALVTFHFFTINWISLWYICSSKCCLLVWWTDVLLKISVPDLIVSFLDENYLSYFLSIALPVFHLILLIFLLITVYDVHLNNVLQSFRCHGLMSDYSFNCGSIHIMLNNFEYSKSFSKSFCKRLYFRFFSWKIIDMYIGVVRICVGLVVVVIVILIQSDSLALWTNLFNQMLN